MGAGFRPFYGIVKYPWGVPEKLETSLGKVIGWGLIAATLMVTPWWTLDPINPIKMLVVVSVGFMCFGLLMANWKSVNPGKYKVVFALIAAFVVWQVVVVLISGGQMYQQLFGSNGRNTGFITYTAFSLIFVGAVIAASADVLKKLLIILNKIYSNINKNTNFIYIF